LAVAKGQLPEDKSQLLPELLSNSAQLLFYPEVKGFCSDQKSFCTGKCPRTGSKKSFTAGKGLLLEANDFYLAAKGLCSTAVGNSPLPSQNLRGGLDSMQIHSYIPTCLQGSSPQASEYRASLARFLSSLIDSRRLDSG
jgi:hypothetical protein